MTNCKTTITLKWFPLDATPEERKTFDGARGGFAQGWTGTFDQLTAYLASSASAEWGQLTELSLPG